jgi:hypothetical protein
MKKYIPKDVITDKQDAAIALKTVLNILEKWQCSAEEKYTLLGVPRSTYFKYLQSPTHANIDVNLLERLSYILNIHGALRILFNNPDSVYSWIRKPNKAPLFNDYSALDKMLSGKIADLSDVSRYLNAQRGGWS